VFRHTQAFWLLLALNGAALAQIQRPPPPPVTVPNLPPGPGATPGRTGNVRLQFPNADVKDVLNLYQRIADVRLVYDNQVVGPVNIFIEGELPADEAKLIIEINLLMNGFTLVPVEGTKIVKVIGIGKSPRTAGIRIISDELQIPTGEEVVCYLAKLRYADPTEVTQVLGTFVVQSPGQYTNITPLPKSSALLITENSAILRGIVKVIHEMDIPPAEVVDKFIPLERADAEDVQKKLLDIFQKSPATPGQPGSTPAGGAAVRGTVIPRPPLPDGSQAPAGVTAEQTGQNTIEISSGALTEDAVIVGKITLTADKRTNRIHVVTRPVNIRFVEKLIREFDQDVKFGEPSIRKLKYVSASDIFQVVVKAITDPGAQDVSTAAGGGTGSRPTTTQPRTDSLNRAGGLGSSSSGGGGGASQTLSESLSAEERDIVPDAVTVGNAKLIADKRANAIIVLGNKEVKDKVFRVIDELDVRAPQVLLHTVIGQLTLSNREEFGVNYFVRKANELGQNPAGAGTGSGAGSIAGLAALSSIVGVGTNGAPALNFNNLLLARNFETAIAGGASGLSGFIGAGNTLDAIVTALSTNNRFRVTARPSIFTSNNKKAIISSGEEIAIPSSIQSGFSGGNINNGNNLVTNSTIQFKTVALQLEVLPLINADRDVTLDIVQKFDEQVGTTTIDNNDIPRIATRVLQTTVSVPNESTLVLGGLIRQNNNKTTSGIPYLSKIPILGALFRSNRDDKTREELVILIRPVVTFSPNEDVKARERSQEFLNLPPDLEPSIYPNPTKVTTTQKKMLRRPSMPLRESMVEVDPAPIVTRK
jgi:type II secretion system protein D